jgi:hypothetical protein
LCVNLFPSHCRDDGAIAFQPVDRVRYRRYSRGAAYGRGAIKEGLRS